MINPILKERYQIQKELGRQTGRRTFLAEDLQTQQQVVIKLLLLGQDFDWQDLKLFEREAETLKKLNHANIPSYLDYFELDDTGDKGFGLVQSYVEGKTLESHLKSGRTFRELEVKELALRLLEILSYLHQHEPVVIHRDIKPSNILLTDRSGNCTGDVYLVDFGSVQTIAATNGGTITVVGTYGYMPPEQFGGRCVEASDLYSLGATLIFLVTGLHPTELPQKDLQIQFRQTANFSTEFADWLEWMIEPSLSQRFKSTEEAILALDNPIPRKKNNYLSTQKFDKPVSSEIKLHKDDDGVEIIIPPQGFRIIQIALISLASPFALGIFLTKFTIGNKLPQRNLLLDHYLQIFGVSFILFILLWAFFKITRLQISQNRFVLTYELLGTKSRWFSKKINDQISKLELTTHPGWTHDSVEHMLFMKTQSQKFCLSRYANFTPEELEWLAQEIGDYLNVPIDRV